MRQGGGSAASLGELYSSAGGAWPFAAFWAIQQTF